MTLPFLNIHGDNVSDMYEELLRHFASIEMTSAPRGLPIREERNVFMIFLDTLRPRLPITQSKQRNITMQKYVNAEIDLYSTGERRADVWAERASKFWSKLADEHGLINSNYGDLVYRMQDSESGMSQFEWAKYCLQHDPDTRQAIIHFNRPCHQKIGVKDFVCTMHAQFFIRDGLLSMDVVMRSQDIVKGWPYDQHFFMSLLLRMGWELKYPVKYMTLLVHSLHMYEKDFKLVKEMIYGNPGRPR